MTQVQMALSQHDQERLCARVERKLAGRRISRAVVRAAVEQVSGAIYSSGTPQSQPDVVVVMSAASTPDMASRLSQHLTARGVVPVAQRRGQQGRFTVVVLQLHANDVDAVREAGNALGFATAGHMAASELTV
ncbi:MAG: hypothetical protein U0163_11530 [Gemmatimonadaceae bacterium]